MTLTKKQKKLANMLEIYDLIKIYDEFRFNCEERDHPNSVLFYNIEKYQIMGRCEACSTEFKRPMTPEEFRAYHKRDSIFEQPSRN